MTQYRPLGTESAPAEWVLPASLDFTIEAIYATFNGTAAAGSFIPTVEVVSDAGATEVKVPQDASVAAGSSVDASWAPFLRSQSSGGGTSCAGTIDSTQTAGNTCGVHSVGAQQFRVLVADGSGGSRWTTIQSAEEIAINAGVSVGGTGTASLALGHSLGSALLDYTIPATPKVLQRGMYGGFVTVQVGGTATSRNRFQMSLVVGQVSYAANASALDVFSDSLTETIEGTLPISGFMAAGDSLQVNVVNLDTGARTFSVPVFRLERILTV